MKFRTDGSTDLLLLLLSLSDCDLLRQDSEERDVVGVDGAAPAAAADDDLDDERSALGVLEDESFMLVVDDVDVDERSASLRRRFDGVTLAGECFA